MSSAANLSSSLVLIFILARTSASLLFGVTSSQIGRSFLLSALARSSCIRVLPVPATMTGSTTRGASWSSRMSATVPTISALYSIPVLMALMSESFRTASSWALMNSSETGRMPLTPVVFWAVKAVMTVAAWTPTADMAFTSAWMPAPPIESEPATVSAVLISRAIPCIFLISVIVGTDLPAGRDEESLDIPCIHSSRERTQILR